MDQPTVLRETRMGEKGFKKEDVLTYLDELNSKIEGLEEDLKNASEKGPSDPQEIIKFRNQVDSLQEKLNKSNQALRDAKKENEELQKQIAALKAGNPAAAANPQTQAALEAAKKEIDNLRNQLKAANEKAAAAPAPANAQITAALEAAKKEIDNLRNQLKAAEQKVSAAEQKAAAAEQKAAAAAANGSAAAPAADNSAITAELKKAKEDLAKANADLNAKSEEIKKKTAELEAKIKETAEMESKISELTKNAESAAAKDEEISKLNAEVVQLKEAANNPAALMGSLFAEAQKTVTQLKQQAEQEAEQTKKDAAEQASKTTREADELAAKTTREADEKAEKVIKEANETAERTVKDANYAAETAIREANERAKVTINDANAKADKINELSSTVRSMLLNEIESVSTKFSDLTSALNKLNNQTADKMNEAKLIIGEARKAVEPTDDTTVKRAEAPKADFNAAKAPSATHEKKETKPSDPFANVMGGSYNHGSSNSFNNSSKPASAPSNEAAKPSAPVPPKKPASNFNFDMSDLLKAAEEEAAKEDAE